MSQRLFSSKHYSAPVAREIPYEMTNHGETRQDPYYWLNQRENAEVIAYLHAENKYTDHVLAPVHHLKNDLFKELKSRIKEEDQSVPYLKHGYLYYTRFESGREYPIYCRKKYESNGKEQILLDVNKLAEGHDYVLALELKVSPDDRYMIYMVDYSGRNLFVASILDLQTGQLLPDRFETAGGYDWMNDSKTLLYDTKDPVTLRSDKVWRHTLGKPEDELLFSETDETVNVDIHKSKSGQYLFLNHGYTQNVETHYLSADDITGQFKVIKPRENEFFYQVDHFGDQFFILTNQDGAKNFKIVSAPVSNPDVHHWKELIPHDETTLIENFEIFKDHLAILMHKNAMNQVMIRTWSDGMSHFVDFGEPTYGVSFGENFEFDTPQLRYRFNSFKTPMTVVDYDMKTRIKTIRKVQPVLGGFNPDDYLTELLWVEARDGTSVPVSVIHRKDLVKDGTAPCYLVGYGSYGIIYEPDFNSNWLTLVNRGFVCAIAHIRGGMEMGFTWYEQGKMNHKMNTFHDFIDCAQNLIDNKYTSSDKLFASGRSAGGLLMGAIVNMRSDLFKGILTGVPFVDVLTTMSDPSIPLTTGEYTEWGNPAIKEEYDYMRKYSPYDNLQAKDYPHLYCSTSYQDSQVQYFEPAKYVARLRKLKTDHNLVLLRTNMTGSHGGSSGRFQKLVERAEEYAFILGILGIGQ